MKKDFREFAPNVVSSAVYTVLTAKEMAMEALEIAERSPGSDPFAITMCYSQMRLDPNSPIDKIRCNPL